jgi:hypothetical protein
VRGSGDSLELVSVVLTLYVRTLGEEEGRSLKGAVWWAAAVTGTELGEGSSGRVRRTKESTERDFLSLECERLVVGDIEEQWTSMGGKRGLPSAGIFVVVVLGGGKRVEERVGWNSAAINTE